MNETLKKIKLMTDIEQSEFIRANYPATYHSMATRRMVRGIGINDADYNVTVRIGSSSVACKIYTQWMSVIRLSIMYSRTICENWLKFSNFRRWVIENKKDGMILSIDLVSDSSHYSPESCIFAPTWLAYFINDGRRGRSDVHGASHDPDGKYSVRLYSDGDFGSRIGRFETKEKAQKAWIRVKKERALKLKKEMDDIDTRIYPRIIKRINSYWLDDKGA